ncbi:gliding motility-associated C-terminal domain-containing protein [Tenacibaculum maritimum]|uniref:gliding motility-associated C-terminal domain-containing protein n=1 Tax=Tenacibaculum maritimum TaxID=107401 RepID=UPI0012E46476|nr:gliding motility-associated C-terminal domain-containing protein [Tenacibaculum maritimum]CAA0192818.1 Protein of unknown function precursor containing a C-terminal secretion signal [Tenacibaculum maritimum]
MIKKITLLIILCYIKSAFGHHLLYKNSYEIFNNSLSEITICEGETLELTAAPIQGAQYEWKTVKNETVMGIDLIRTNISIDMEGEYSLKVTLNGCTNITFINVIVLPKPNAGINGTLHLIEGITPTTEELFSALGGNPSTKGTWSFKNNIYTYTVTATNSCKSTATSTVTITNTISIVNGFSPNGDNINDTWQILPDLLNRYPNNILTVFNRYGNIVHKAAPYKNDWNAVSNGKAIINNRKKLPPASYYYVLQLNNPHKTIFKGWVYINY